MKKCLIILSLLLAGSVQAMDFTFNPGNPGGSKPTSDDLQKSTKLLGALFDYFNNDRDQRSLEQYSGQKYESVTDDRGVMDRNFEDQNGTSPFFFSRKNGDSFFQNQELDSVVIDFLKIQPRNVLFAASQNPKFQNINPESSNAQDSIMLKIIGHINSVLRPANAVADPALLLMNAVIAYGQAQLNYAQTFRLADTSYLLPYANQRLLAEQQMPSGETRFSLTNGTLSQLQTAQSNFTNILLAANKSLINTTSGSADMTPLMMALRYHSIEMVSDLLAAGAKTNSSYYSGHVTSTESTGVTTYLNNNNFTSTKDLYNALENLLSKNN